MQRIKKATMTVEANGVTYFFPNVELEIKPNIKPGLEFGEPGYWYEKGPDRLTSMSITGTALPGDDDSHFILTATMEAKEVTCNVPQLNGDDLVMINDAMSILDNLSQTGVFSCELRVKTDDYDTWVVIGYGEDGNPCILRFEKDNG